MNRIYGTWSALYYLLVDIVLTVEVVGILFFAGDPLGIVPSGADRAEEVIFGMTLFIVTEFASLKSGAFGFLAKRGVK